MEKLLRLALQHYNSFKSQAALSGKWEQVVKKEEYFQRIQLAGLRAEMIQNWLMMLNYDERFAIEQHLILDLEWQRVVHVFGKHWDGLYFRSDRRLGDYQADALRKIVSYCNTYEDIITCLFGDLEETEHLLTNGTMNARRSSVQADNAQGKTKAADPISSPKDR